MAEYIEKGKAAQILSEEASAHYPTAFHVGLYAAARAIDSIPAADVAPVRHGRWMKKDDGECYWYVCSECGDKPPKDQWEYQWLSPYCPNCGAKMDGGEENK